MRSYRPLFLVLACALAAPPLAACTQKADPERELALQIKQGIRLLEQRKDEEFLDKFMAPEEYAKYRPGEDKASKVEFFRVMAHDKLEKRLRQAEGQKATFNADKTEATFALKPEIQWRLIDGHWRIMN